MSRASPTTLTVAPPAMAGAFQCAVLFAVVLFDRRSGTSRWRDGRSDPGAHSEGMEEQLQLTIRPRPKRLDEYGEVLTVEEAAAVLRISRSSAYELARRWRSDNPSGLPVIQLGRFLRVPRSALEEMLARPNRIYATPDDRG